MKSLTNALLILIVANFFGACQGYMVVTNQPQISYGTSEKFFGTVGTPLTITPSVLFTGGSKTICSSTTLPAGLSLNSDTCVISGTPTASTKETDYTITASNFTGSISTTISLTTYMFAGVPVSGFGNSFGSVPFDVNPDYTTATSAVFKDIVRGANVQPDGKLLICGTTSKALDSGPTDGFVVRLNTDGTLDSSFNSTGKYLYNSAANARDNLFDVKVFNNKIYVFGSSRSSGAGTADRALVFRLNMDGTLDTTFATNGEALHFSGNLSAFIFKGEIIADGSILAYGYNVVASVRQYFIIKLTSSGAFDTTFGTSGVYYYPSVYTSSEGHFEVDSSGKIVATFHSGSTTAYKTTVIKLTSAGVLDASFGTNGVYELTLGAANYPRTLHLIGNDIVIYGIATSDLTNFFTFILKLDEFGAPLSSWGVAGLREYSSDPVLQTLLGGYSIVIDDQMVITGYRGNDFVLTSVNMKNGDVIGTFGTSGFFQSSTTTPTTRVVRIVADSSRNIFWGAGITDSNSTNTLVHSVKFK